MMIENNKWYKTGFGSLYFKTRDRGFSSVEGFGYSYSTNLWCKSEYLIPRSRLGRNNITHKGIRVYPEGNEI